jgi:hypothetical protein
VHWLSATRGTVVRRRLVQCLVALLVGALAVAPVQGDPTLQASLNSLHRLTISFDGERNATQAVEWRKAVDGDESHSVSALEIAIAVGTFEYLVANPAALPADVYFKIQDLENATGAPAFTANGRSNLTQFAMAEASGFAMKARLDGENGTMERLAITFTNLAGPLTANASFSTREEFVFTWLGVGAPGDHHSIEMEVRPLVALSIGLAGAFEIVSWVGINDAATDWGMTTLSGQAAGSLVSVSFRERPTSVAAQVFVLGAIVAGAAAAAVASLVVARRHEIHDKPLPVAPKYK